MTDHFKPTYNYILIMTIMIIGYVVAITFLPIPEKNQRFVDITLAFLLGLLAGNSNYLTGGNPSPNKSTTTPGTTTADISATVTTAPPDQKGTDNSPT